MLSFLVQRSIVYRLRTATETETQCVPRQQRPFANGNPSPLPHVYTFDRYAFYA
jgi:hypothetical protein